jgi:hypothetical protein
MSFLPDFEDDVFISYAHIDDQPLTKGQMGWISKFHQALELRLSQLLGTEPKVGRDPDLRGNDFWEQRLMGRIPKIAILVSVISPRYVRSEWCLREMREFYKFADQTAGDRSVAKSRIFKVIKTPVSSENEPPEIKNLLGYEFYQFEKSTRRLRELNLAKDPSVKKNYYRKLDDVAYDIHQLLERLKAPTRTVPSKEPDINVYLAETTFDLKDERDSIRRELQQRGYGVLPDESLPSNAADFQNAVRGYLERCRLSVHLIGENYGDVPRTETRSLVSLQNELAAERSLEAGFSRLIWMPIDLKTSDERQQKFIDYLQRDAMAQRGAELLQTTVEELKTVIEDKLVQGKQSALRPTAASGGLGGPLHIYLICDQEDRPSVLPLRDYLFDQGYEAVLPAVEGEESEIREVHNKNLLLCDACLIYYGAGNGSWLQSKLLDLQKIAGYGRSKPMLAKCVYVSARETEDKREFKTHDATVIKNFAAFSPDSLEPFLVQLAPTESVKGARL